MITMALHEPRRGPGRPPKKGEVLTVERPFKFAPSVYSQMQEASLQNNISIAEFVRRAVDEKLSGRFVDLAQIGSNDVTLRLLTAATCGPWEEALLHAGTYTLSDDIADTLGATSNDVVVRSIGDSMSGAGIQDDFLVVMRLLPSHAQPKRNEPTLVQAITEDGQCLGTIKKWVPGTPPQLLDGNDNTYEFPAKTIKVQAVAVALGVIGRV